MRVGRLGAFCKGRSARFLWATHSPLDEQVKEGRAFSSSLRNSSATPVLKDATKDMSASNITWAGASINGVLGLGKLTAGVYSNSAALIADAAHSISDLISDFVTLASIKIAQQPPDQTHPFGYGKYETIGAFVVSGILIMTAGGTAVHSLDLLVPAWSSNSAHPELVIPFHSAAIAVAVGSIVSKELLYRKTMNVAKSLRSKVLEANAWHHRTDALSSIVALGALLGSSAGYHFLDPVGGLVVSGMILKAGVSIGWDSIQDLADGSEQNLALRQNIKDLVKGFAAQSSGEIVGCHSIRTRSVGNEVFVDLSIFVDQELTVSAAHNASERISRFIEAEVEEVVEVLVHVEFEPHGKQSPIMRPHPKIKDDVQAVVSQIPQVWGVTHVRTHFWEGKVHVELEIQIADRFSVREAKEIGEDARKRILEGIPDVSSADVHLEL